MEAGRDQGPGRKEAIVLSGGGANGAYEVGVVRALLSGSSAVSANRPVDAEILSGTSVGGYNAAVLASFPDEHHAENADRLVRIWRRRIASVPGRCGNGIYRVRGAELLDPACAVRNPSRSLAKIVSDAVFFAGQGIGEGLDFVESRRPLVQRLLEAVDLSAAISTEPMRQLILRTVDKEGLARSRRTLKIAASNWDRGVVRVFDKSEIVGLRGRRVIRASASIPGIFQPVRIGRDRDCGALGCVLPES